MLHTLLALVAFVFALASLSAHAAPCAGFTDVEDTSPFCVNVAWMRNRGITLGCAATLYCPNDFVTRLQMAAFMYRLGFQNAHLQGGNAFGATSVLGTTDNQPLDIHVNNSRVMRYEPNAISPNVIGGHLANNVTAGVRGATIAGGGNTVGDSDPDFTLESPNRVTDHYGTVGGGYANQAGDAFAPSTDRAGATVAGGLVNTASGLGSTVGGGTNNTASGGWSTVPGGFANHATADRGTVVGGENNTASGPYSTVVGGRVNDASGAYSLAGGVSANANADRCFVFAGWSNLPLGGERASCLGSSNVVRFMVDHGLSIDYFSARLDGGGNRWVYICDLVAGDTITTWTGAHLTNSGVWTNASDRALKDGFAPIDPQAVLDSVVRLPVTRWHYRHDGPEVQHIGPTAQDFKAAFGLGQSDKGIGTVDADGVALAAIQGLNAKVETQAKVIAEQAREIVELKRVHAQEIGELRRLVEKLAAPK